MVEVNTINRINCMQQFKYHLGIDLHKRTSYWTLMDDDRRVLFRKNMETSESAMDTSLAAIGLDPRTIEAAIEPVSQWGWYGDLLAARGLRVRLVDVYKSKLIANSKLKHDRVDSKTLAEMMRSDFLPEAYRAPRETRDLREFVRGRAFLVRMRTRIRNRITGILGKHGIISPWTDTFGKGGRRWLDEQRLGHPHDGELQNLRAVFDDLTLHIAGLDRECASRVSDSADLAILTSIPGIGSITALMILAEVGDFSRFPTPGQLASFAGLVASSHSSGERSRFGHITHRGSVWLRSALVESTGKVSPKWGYLHAFYRRIQKKKGNSIARVALARKVLALCWHLMRTRQRFNPHPFGSEDSVKTGSSNIS